MCKLIIVLRGMGNQMKILVTGANGYLGTGIVKKLLDKDYEVVATDLIVDNIDERAIRISCDLFALENPFEYFGQPEIVLHLAWRDGFVHQSENHIIDLPKHYMFLSRMISGGIRRVAVLGSMHEVGRYEGEINEDTPTNPVTLYGIAKNALRQSLQVLCSNKNVPLQWIRGFYIVSSDTKGSSIFSKIAQAVKEGKKTFPFTSGTNKYDFLDYEDFCDRVAMIVMQDKITGIINCCSGEAIALKDKVEDFIAENKFEIILEYGAFPDRAYDTKAIWGNNNKINLIIEQSSRG